MYEVRNTFIIYNNVTDKHVCICATAEIAQRLVTIINEADRLATQLEKEEK